MRLQPAYSLLLLVLLLTLLLPTLLLSLLLSLLLLLLYTQWRAAVQRLWLIDKSDKTAGGASPFQLPQSGTLELVCKWVPLPATQHSLLNASGLQHLESLMCKRSGSSSSSSSSSSSESGDTRLLFARLAGRDLYFLGSQVGTATTAIAAAAVAATVKYISYCE
jgi:hypothetical protein